MNRDTPLDSKKARRVSPPLPHPSWRHAPPPPVQPAERTLTAAEFWERLGL